MNNQIERYNNTSNQIKDNTLIDSMQYKLGENECWRDTYNNDQFFKVRIQKDNKDNIKTNKGKK